MVKCRTKADSVTRNTFRRSRTSATTSGSTWPTISIIRTITHGLSCIVSRVTFWATQTMPARHVEYMGGLLE